MVALNKCSGLVEHENKKTSKLISDKKNSFFNRNLDILNNYPCIGVPVFGKAPDPITSPNVCREGKWFIPT